MNTTTQTIEIKMKYKIHPKHISYEYVLRVCKHCGELYYSIIENFYGMDSCRKISHTVYDQSVKLGNSPFLYHLETHEVENQ